MTQHMLSTVDNPFNPFVDFDDWFAFDTSNDHHSSAFLARVVVSSDELSEADQHLAIEQGIDEIVMNDVSGLFIKVSEVTAIVRPGV